MTAKSKTVDVVQEFMDMLRQVLAAFAIVCATGVILGFGTTRSQHNREPRGTPSLRLDKTIERLAPAPPGTRVTARFTLYNDGTAPMRVCYLQSSCGCVQTELSRTEVPPGETADLHAQVLVPRVGRRESKIQFFTNSDAREPVTLTVIAQSEVALPYVIGESDCRIVFNEWLTAGVHGTAVVRTREKAGSAPWLRRFETDLPCVRVRLLEVQDAQSPDEPAEIEREYRLELSLAGELPTSSRQGRLLAFPAEVESPEVLGPVLVNPADPIELNPSSIYVTPGAAETPRTVYVRVMQPNFDLECSIRQPLPDGIEVRPGKQDHGIQEFFLYLTDAAPKRDADNPTRWEIVFLTNHPEMPEITLPVVLRR